MRKRADYGDATSCLGNTGERTTRKTLGYLELSLYYCSNLTVPGASAPA